MLQNQPNPTQLFRNSLRSWREAYVAKQQIRAELAGPSEATSEAPAGPQRVKRLAPRRRKRRQTASA